MTTSDAPVILLSAIARQACNTMKVVQSCARAISFSAAWIGEGNSNATSRADDGWSGRRDLSTGSARVGSTPASVSDQNSSWRPAKLCGSAGSPRMVLCQAE